MVAHADNKHTAAGRDISQEKRQRIQSPGIECIPIKEFLLVWADPGKISFASFICCENISNMEFLCAQ